MKPVIINVIIIITSILLIIGIFNILLADNIEFQEQSLEKQQGQIIGQSSFYGLVLASAVIMGLRIIKKVKSKRNP